MAWGFITFFSLTLGLGCASLKSGLGIYTSDPVMPIANPFASYQKSTTEGGLTLRTRRGDKTLELQLPPEVGSARDLVFPLNPDFKDSLRTPASVGSEGIDDKYRAHTPTQSDREIISTLSQGSPEETNRRNDLEKELHLVGTEDRLPPDQAVSYLAGLDRIKQLYHLGRYEAALIETDEMLIPFQTDPKLYAMRGTLLDRLGRRELAMKAWRQAYHFDPGNKGLKKFLDRKLPSKKTEKST